MTGDTDKLSRKEGICLDFLSDKMEATSYMVGMGILRVTHTGFSFPEHKYTYLGSGVLGHLNKKGFVMRLPELKAWRLTRKGRDYVSKR